MNIKNYTSEVPASRSISIIHQMLVDIGAESITYNMEGKVTVGITFLYTDPSLGHTLAFRFRAKVDEAYKILYAQYKKPTADTSARVREQANRTAWKILADWVSIQCSMILLDQASPLQMFLPYVYDIRDDETLFQKITSGKIKLLPPAS